MAHLKDDHRLLEQTTAEFHGAMNDHRTFRNEINALRNELRRVSTAVLTGRVSDLEAAAADLPLGLLGYAEVTSSQASISSAVDLTDLSVTVTAGASRRLRVSAQVAGLPSTADNLIMVRIQEDTTVFSEFSLTLARTNASESLYGEVVVTPSSGSHTYKLVGLMAVGTGTVQMTAGATRPAFILVEDIGPA
jgi:hypothetical protein